jgi:hypothetical protein
MYNKFNKNTQSIQCHTDILLHVILHAVIINLHALTNTAFCYIYIYTSKEGYVHDHHHKVQFKMAGN